MASFIVSRARMNIYFILQSEDPSAHLLVRSVSIDYVDCQSRMVIIFSYSTWSLLNTLSLRYLDLFSEPHQTTYHSNTDVLIRQVT